MANKNYFTPDEVNALIPRLEEHFRNFWSFRENAQTILEEFRTGGKGPRALAEGNEEEDPEQVALGQMRRSQAHFLLEQAKKELDVIMETGCSIKDLETGLVDFPHLLEFEEEEVYLCWKYGEKKVRFWHELDQGFTSRKPLPRRVPNQQ